MFQYNTFTILWTELAARLNQIFGVFFKQKKKAKERKQKSWLISTFLGSQVCHPRRNIKFKLSVLLYT